MSRIIRAYLIETLIVYLISSVGQFPTSPQESFPYRMVNWIALFRIEYRAQSLSQMMNHVFLN